MARRNFKDSSLRRMYLFMLEHGDDSETTKVSGSGTLAAYRRGYNGTFTQANTYDRASLAYAAWAAGVDRHREANRG